MKRDAPPAAEPSSSTTTTNRAGTKDKSTETDSPEDGAKGHGKQLRDMNDLQPLTPKGNDMPDANNNRMITGDEQFIDSSKLFSGAREIKRAELKINADGFNELPKGYEPAFANKVVSVTMKNKANTLFSQPQNAIQPRYASNLRPSRPLGHEEVGNVTETPRGEIKGVKALRDFFENEAFKDRNGLILDNDSAHNRSSGYESADDDSGYESDGSTNDSVSTKDLYHARRVQVDETDASRDETDSVTHGTDEISEVKKLRCSIRKIW